MTNDLAGLLAELRSDHKNMAVMLDLLENEANRLYRGEDGDYELMHDLMRYMTVYPDSLKLFRSTSNSKAWDGVVAFLRPFSEK